MIISTGDIVQIKLFEGMTPTWVKITKGFYAQDDIPEGTFQGDIMKRDGPRILNQTVGYLIEFKYCDIVKYIPREWIKTNASLLVTYGYPDSSK